MSQLSSKQHEFCQCIVENLNPIEAYQNAYDTKRLKPETVERRAQELLESPVIQVRLRSLRSSQGLIDSFNDKYLDDVPRPMKANDGDEKEHHNASELEYYAALSKSTGSPDPVFMNMLVRQLSKVVDEELDITGLNELLSTMSGIAPEDEVEGMLAAQMVAVHTSIMKMAETLLKEPGFLFQQNAVSLLNKLMRTFAQQIETLNKYRGKGHQRMTVKHVHVHNGGQAIVGQVNNEGVSKKWKEQPDGQDVWRKVEDWGTLSDRSDA